MNRQLFEYHPTIGYKFIPNLKARIPHEAGGYLLRTNNAGFRSEIEFKPEREQGKKKILFFGDSYTAGDGVSNKYRYTDVLAQLLPSTDIYNFGLSGSGTDQQYLLYKEYGRTMDYDLLVIMVLVENIRRVNSHYRIYYDDRGEKRVYQKPYFDLQQGQLMLHNVPVNPSSIRMEDLPLHEQAKVDTGGKFGSVRSVINKLGLKKVVQKISRYQPVPEYDRANSKEWLTMKAILKQWSESAKSKVLIVPLPLYQHLEETSSPTNYQKRFQELSGIANLHLFDPLPRIRKYPMEERKQFRFKTDVHPTPEFHKAIAESLAPIVRSLL